MLAETSFLLWFYILYCFRSFNHCKNETSNHYCYNKENEKYYLVKEFDSVVPSLAVAYAHSKYGYGYYTVFIDIDGNKSVKGANFSNLRFNFFKQTFLKTFTTYEETIMAYLNSIQFKYIHFDLDIDDNLIVSNKTEYEIDKNQKVITSHNPICVNEMGYPDGSSLLHILV